jgi:hypothetical protein
VNQPLGAHVAPGGWPARRDASIGHQRRLISPWRAYSARMRPFDDILRLERAEALDRLAAAVRAVVQRVLHNRTLKDALHGVWLGHPLHPALAQIALGSFTSASLIEAVGGGRRESSGLIAVGLASTVPTVAAGWADWSESHEGQQRVGLVHAALNAAAVACFAAALLQRRGGRGTGGLLSLVGGTLSGAGAALGGHLWYRQATGANHGNEVPHVGPGNWQPLGPLAESPLGQPVRRLAGDVPVSCFAMAPPPRSRCCPTAARTCPRRCTKASCPQSTERCASPAPGTRACSGSAMVGSCTVRRRHRCPASNPGARACFRCGYVLCRASRRVD